MIPSPTPVYLQPKVTDDARAAEMPPTPTPKAAPKVTPTTVVPKTTPTTVATATTPTTAVKQ
jgi:hypothetical protein